MTNCEAENLNTYFYSEHISGENLDGKLTIDRFLEFQEELQTAILTLEFQRKNPDDDGLIAEKQFAELLLVSQAGCTLWPDLTTFHQFDKIFQVFGNILRVYLVFGMIVKLLW